MKIVGYAGEIVFDVGKPDSTARRILNSQQLDMLGWRAEVELAEELVLTQVSGPRRISAKKQVSITGMAQSSGGRRSRMWAELFNPAESTENHIGS